MTTFKVLIAYDGSELALDAVRYVAEVMPLTQTEIVLFYVDTDVPELFWNPEKGMDFRYQAQQVRASVTRDHKSLAASMLTARNILQDAGAQAKNIIQKIRPREIGVAQDIINEARQGYQAVVVGRSGNSKIKDMLIGSTATQILDKTGKVPLITVGGTVSPRRILVAFDHSKEIQRAIRIIGSLLGVTSCHVLLCYVLVPHSIFQKGDELQWQTAEKKRITPLLDQACDELRQMGLPERNVTSEIIFDDVSKSSGIVNKAKTDKYGTIVVGRRGLTVIKEFFTGHVGRKIFQIAGDLTTWVIR